MGLFDSVMCLSPEFMCSEGHSLNDEVFQTKDLGQTMGEAVIAQDGRFTFTPDLLFSDGTASAPITDTISVYSTCRKCPVFVQANTFNLVACWVEFEIEIVDDQVRSVRRVSQDTATWLQETPTKTWMKSCLGPMTYEEAGQVHVLRG